MSKFFFAPLGVIASIVVYDHIIANPLLEGSANEAIALYAFLSIISVSVFLLLGDD